MERLQNVLVKSWREAKLYTSWNNPDKDYEAAVAEFVTTILTPVAENHFLPDFVKFQQRIAASGACLSLAQTLVRLVSPGVPDIYQGAELWELSMVDPDNRRPVDFAKRKALLADLADRHGPGLLKNWQSGSVKQYVIQQALGFRREHPEVFRARRVHPAWRPSDIMPSHADRVCAPLRNDVDNRGRSALFREAVEILAALPRARGRSPIRTWPFLQTRPAAGPTSSPARASKFQAPGAWRRQPCWAASPLPFSPQFRSDRCIAAFTPLNPSIHRHYAAHD